MTVLLMCCTGSVQQYKILSEVALDQTRVLQQRLEDTSQERTSLETVREDLRRLAEKSDETAIVGKLQLQLVHV